MTSVSLNGFTWHDLVRPKEEDLRVLQESYGFHDLDIDDCLSEHERPKIEEYDNYFFLVFHIPCVLKQSGRILKEEVNIFIGTDFFVTIHDGRFGIFDQLREQLAQGLTEEQQEFPDQGPSFLLYEVMSRLFNEGFPIVDNISKELRSIELQLFEHEEETDVLRDILALKRNIIAMRSILLPQRSLIALLEHRNQKFIAPDLAIYFDNILDAIERQWALLDTAKEMSEALQETHESWLSHKTNSIIRALTVINVLALPPLIITSMYGMNIPLPFADSGYAYIAILGFMLFVGVFGIWYSHKKKWL
jgi:magnesium transporter